jgi:UDP-glucose 4-epimerase
MRVVVTGGAGFIGSHVADAYVARQWEVFVVDNLSTGNRVNLNPAATFMEGDLRSEQTIQAIGALRPDLVSHHAAQVDLRKSVAAPAADAELNIVASIRLLEACRAAGVRRFVFASSGGAIYGEPRFAPQSEAHPPGPLSPYGCAKLSFEHYLESYRAVHDLRTVALRYANVYGPRQDERGEAGVVAIFAGRILRGLDVTINGSGRQTRDFVYVADVVAANLAVTDDPALDGPYNVGTGVETSVLELYEQMNAIAGGHSRAAHAEAKVGEQMRSVLDGSLLRNAAALPEPASLAEGLPKTVAWFRNPEPGAGR